MKLAVRISLGLVAVSLTIIMGYGTFMYLKVKSAAEKMYEPRDPVQQVSLLDTRGGGDFPVDMKDREPFNALIMGVDERANDRGRSDTMIVVSVNPAKKCTLMFNIPRDTRTTIVGHGTEDKINHAYAFGGVEMSVRTVENFLDIPINYYMKVNMEGFSNLIDSIGGVDVYNDFEFEYEGHTFAKGTIHLDGTNALRFSRMRYDDPKGDLGRNGRQREIIKQVLDSTLKVSNVLQFESLLERWSDQVRTDATFDEMKSFFFNYRDSLDHIETVEIKGKGEKINGIYYYMVDSAERNRIHDMIDEHVE